ncbi:DUF5916 domain-containing protein [Gammaproteobacteria bacterium]|nr:DUF5916 domain-containing protein [Gammaproteobacteria bacterium]
MFRPASLALLLVISNASLADLWVNISSFSSNARAEKARVDATDALKTDLLVKGAETKRGYFFRVVAGPYRTRDDAAGLLERARALGFKGLWVIEDSMPASSFNEAPAGVNAQSSVVTERVPTVSVRRLPTAREVAVPASTEEGANKKVAPGRQEKPPSNYKLHKLRRDARAQQTPRGPSEGPVSLRVKDGTEITLRRLEIGQSPKIDGKLEKQVWGNLPDLGAFVVTSPDTMVPPPLNTVVRIFYTDRGLYLAALMEQDPSTLVERLSSRDQGHLNRDYFTLHLDTSGEGRYGFFFQLNLGDSISDGTILPERQFSRDWDGAWYGASSRTDDGWVAELHIPWSLLTMPKSNGERVIGIYTGRKVAYRDESYSWPGLPYTKPRFLSAFQPVLMKGVDPRQEYSVYPYVSSTYDSLDGTSDHKVGADVFWRPTSNFQVTATASPDFGNVESDAVIVNLTAFESFYPEKRLFFQEGQEIFTTSSRSSSYSSYGQFKLLHTRRIGGPPIRPIIPEGVQVDYSAFGQPTELHGAIKAIGQAGRVRYGVLGAMESDSDFVGLRDSEYVPIGQEGRDFGAFRAIYENSRSGYRAFGYMTTAVLHRSQDAHVHALDAHYLAKNGTWNVDVQAITSDVADSSQGYGGFADIRYYPRQGVSHSLSLDYFDRHIDINDAGYLRRNDSKSIGYYMRYRRSNLTWLKESSTRFSLSSGWNIAGENTSAGLRFSQNFSFRNLTSLMIDAEFYPSRIEDRNSFGNGSYGISDRLGFDLDYYSDTSKRFFYTIRADWQQEDIDGDRYRIGGSVVWRPTDRMTMSLDGRYTSRDGWLLHRGGSAFASYGANQWSPSLGFDYFVNAKQHLRLAVQWVAIRAKENRRYELLVPGAPLTVGTDPGGDETSDFSISRLSVQLRYRWEIAPLSDLFVVYTQNASLPSSTPGLGFASMFSETFDNPLAEQLVVKLRYRFGS